MQAGFIRAFLADSATQNGLHLITNGGLVAQLVFDSCWSSTCGLGNAGATLDNGVYINPGAGTIDSLSFPSYQCMYNNGAGFLISPEELGMEAVWKIEVENFPAFIIIDDKGNDFYAQTRKPLSIGKKPN